MDTAPPGDNILRTTGTLYDIYADIRPADIVRIVFYNGSKGFQAASGIDTDNWSINRILRVV